MNISSYFQSIVYFIKPMALFQSTIYPDYYCCINKFTEYSDFELDLAKYFYFFFCRIFLYKNVSVVIELSVQRYFLNIKVVQNLWRLWNKKKDTTFSVVCDPRTNCNKSQFLCTDIFNCLLEEQFLLNCFANRSKTDIESSINIVGSLIALPMLIKLIHA